MRGQFPPSTLGPRMTYKITAHCNCVHCVTLIRTGTLGQLVHESPNSTEGTEHTLHRLSVQYVFKCTSYRWEVGVKFD